MIPKGKCYLLHNCPVSLTTLVLEWELCSVSGLDIQVVTVCVFIPVENKNCTPFFQIKKQQEIITP